MKPRSPLIWLCTESLCTAEGLLFPSIMPPIAAAAIATIANAATARRRDVLLAAAGRVELAAVRSAGVATRVTAVAASAPAPAPFGGSGAAAGARRRPAC